MDDVQVDFDAFKTIVGQIGGVKVYLNAPVRYGRSQLYQPNAGAACSTWTRPSRTPGAATCSTRTRRCAPIRVWT